MKPAFVVNNFNKGGFVYRAAASALAQTMPCEVILSDMQSTDNSLGEIERAVAEAPRGADHEVRVLRCQIKGENTFISCSDHFDWIVSQTNAEWIIQCSSDDYSLSDRAKVCMEAVSQHPCSVVATTQFFENAGETNRQAVSGFPQESGYIKAGEGLLRLAYGSVIAAYNRDFLKRVGSFGRNTPDVLWGFLAALDRGFYVVANPQHVHVNHADSNNMGFGGKLAAAAGEDLLRLTELNHFQLLRLYFACWDAAQSLHPEGIPDEDTNALVNMILGQSKGWLDARSRLHANKIIPWIME